MDKEKKNLPPPPPPMAPLNSLHYKNFNAVKIVCNQPPIKPIKEMKNIFWKRIQVNDKTYKELLNFLGNPDGETIWNILNKEDDTISQKYIFNEKMFVEIFGIENLDNEDNNNKKKSHQLAIKDKDCLRILDSKRSLDISIMLKSFKLSVQDIHDAILNIDFNVLNNEKIKKLYASRPTDEEIKAINLITNGLLHIPERYIFEIQKIPNLEERLWCMMFDNYYFEISNNLKLSFKCVSTNIEMISNNRYLYEFLWLLRKMGNYMNGGNLNRGQADGYHIDILPTIRAIKSHSQINLLQYLIYLQITEFASKNSVDNKIPHMECPLPDPILLRDLCYLNFEDFDQNIGELEISIQNMNEANNLENDPHYTQEEEDGVGDYGVSLLHFDFKTNKDEEETQSSSSSSSVSHCQEATSN
ncbi:unnamed protein product [Gordionus sp. m RMFG-2023]